MPAASLTRICEPSASGLLLKVTETFSGGAATVAPAAGLLDSAASCADAGPLPPSSDGCKDDGAQQGAQKLADGAHGRSYS